MPLGPAPHTSIRGPWSVGVTGLIETEFTKQNGRTTEQSKIGFGITAGYSTDNWQFTGSFAPLIWTDDNPSGSLKLQGNPEFILSVGYNFELHGSSWGQSKGLRLRH